MLLASRSQNHVRCHRDRCDPQPVMTLRQHPCSKCRGGIDSHQLQDHVGIGDDRLVKSTAL